MNSEVNELLDGICNVTTWSNDGVTTGIRSDYDEEAIKYRIEL